VHVVQPRGRIALYLDEVEWEDEENDSEAEVEEEGKEIAARKAAERKTAREIIGDDERDSIAPRPIRLAIPTAAASAAVGRSAARVPDEMMAKTTPPSPTVARTPPHQSTPAGLRRTGGSGTRR